MSNPNKQTTEDGSAETLRSSDLLAELETMRCRLFDLANANAGDDKGNAACLLHAASNEINRAMRCLARGNPKGEGIPPHLLAQTLGHFR